MKAVTMPASPAGSARRSSGAAEIAAALDLVGPRLRRVRERRAMTLTDAAERTGFSKSTLSRLENGQRRPSLELLLPWPTCTGYLWTNWSGPQKRVTPGSGRNRVT